MATKTELQATQKKARDKHSAKSNTLVKTYRLNARDVKAFDVLCNKLKCTKAEGLSYLLKLNREAVKSTKLTKQT